MLYLYWLHNDEHTDITSQGYIGVTRRPQRRLYEHQIKRPELAKLKMKILCVGSENYILDIEKTLRPTKNIGLNRMSGGGDPPSHKGIPKSESWKNTVGAKMSKPRVKKDLLNKSKQKSYLCVSPDGTKHEVLGLRQFCRDNGLRQSAMWLVANGKQHSHMGWTCKNIEE